jgi:hypothetical protein
VQTAASSPRVARRKAHNAAKQSTDPHARQMERTLNFYGDKVVSTSGTHGADIGIQRLDELDSRALQHLLACHEKHPICLDLGCGIGAQGMRFAMCGAHSYLYDLIRESNVTRVLRSAGVRIDYVEGDLRRPDVQIPRDVTIAFSQRFVHYLRYSEAKSLFTKVGSRMIREGLLFLSASGINSELGYQYAGKRVDMEHRFAPLHPNMQQRHEILESVCLYDEEELQTLALECGFERVEIWQSGFGNIKGIFRRIS